MQVPFKAKSPTAVMNNQYYICYICIYVCYLAQKNQLNLDLVKHRHTAVSVTTTHNSKILAKQVSQRVRFGVYKENLNPKP